jgi:hypothetical protein
MNILFIPKNYILTEFNTFSIWSSPNEQLKNVNFIATIINESLQKLKEKFNISINKKLYFCIYFSNKEAQEELQRNISSTMLMLPFTSNEESLIICHSPEIHPSNADRQNMLRHLTHEIMHAYNYEVTESTCILGENMMNVKIPSWLNEGIAETVTAEVINDNSILSKYENLIHSFDGILTNAQLDEYINDLNSDKRKLAFAFATIKVNKLLQNSNIWNVLRNNYKTIYH